MDKPFKYIEHENVIYRGNYVTGSGATIMSERASRDGWVPALGESRRKAECFGHSMSEAEAKDFAGADWPVDQNGKNEAA